MQPLLPEAPRDQAESEFTGILRRLADGAPEFLAAAFVDVEGECIDYVSRIDPYDAKVTAAHMHMVLGSLSGSRDKLGLGEPFALEISADEREIWVQRVSGDYVLVVVLAPGFDRSELRAAIACANTEFRAAVGLDMPQWEGSGRRLSVRVRAATGWTYAPQTFSLAGAQITISDVLGRWTESTGLRGDELVCFRVRTDAGQELTLVHDPEGNGWVVRD
jgi:predicted regulator of Ras-like GTPase activity (Roadblock/LC7/MglB family)